MKRFKNKNLNVLIITLIILTVMSVLSIGENSVISTAFNSVSRGLFQLSALATSGAGAKSYEELEAENRELRQQNAQLREQLADYSDVKEENARLWSYYGLKKENPTYDIKPAKVIRRDSNDDYYSFTLDIGSAQGVGVNDPVITENGLVGRVSRADAATCRVSTVLSPDVKAGAVDKLSGDSGIVSGSASLSDRNQTLLSKLSENNSIKEGDLVVTSGTGGVYPPNLIIGQVSELRFNSYDATRDAVITPFEDIRAIKEAAVITDFGQKGEVKKADEK